MLSTNEFGRPCKICKKWINPFMGLQAYPDRVYCHLDANKVFSALLDVAEQKVNEDLKSEVSKHDK